MLRLQFVTKKIIIETGVNVMMHMIRRYSIFQYFEYHDNRGSPVFRLLDEFSYFIFLQGKFLFSKKIPIFVPNNEFN